MKAELEDNGLWYVTLKRHNGESTLIGTDRNALIEEILKTV